MRLVGCGRPLALRYLSMLSADSGRVPLRRGSPEGTSSTSPVRRPLHLAPRVHSHADSTSARRQGQGESSLSIASRVGALAGHLPQWPVVFRLRGLSPPCRFAPRAVCRSIAPCSQSWASPRLARAPCCTDSRSTEVHRVPPDSRPGGQPPRCAARSVRLPRDASPFEVFPSPAAAPRHRVAMPSCRCRGPLPLPPPAPLPRAEAHIRATETRETTSRDRLPDGQPAPRRSALPVDQVTFPKWRFRTPDEGEHVPAEADDLPHPKARPAQGPCSQQSSHTVHTVPEGTARQVASASRPPPTRCPPKRPPRRAAIRVPASPAIARRSARPPTNVHMMRPFLATRTAEAKRLELCCPACFLTDFFSRTEVRV